MTRSVMAMTTLATSMHAQPGVYAVLLGSGVSTGAGIPTGWGVVQNLVRRVAAAETRGDEAEVKKATENAEKWWIDCYGEDLGYSSLLEALAPTSAARQGILAEFFEPTDEDLENGLKAPSRAHLALAELVKRGTVRVIITTNFDRLMEQALASVGVSPQVVSRPEMVNGMKPLAHSPVTVIKLHGDYKDLDSLNTSEELAEYPGEWEKLLRQVFDEYGLLISGWSAEWDKALVKIMEESPNRRYPLYWDSKSSRGAVAKGLLTARNGQVIQSDGADELFADLLTSIDSLERLSSSPLTIAMATAKLKRYLPRSECRIELHDLVMHFVEEVVSEISQQPLIEPSLDGAKVQEVWAEHLASAAPLLHLLSTGVWHDSAGAHDQLWIDVLQHLTDAGTQPISQWTEGLQVARLTPALLAFSTMCVAAVARGREELIVRLATEVEGRVGVGRDEPVPACHLLYPERVMSNSWVKAMPRWGGTSYIYPTSRLLREDTYAAVRSLVPVERNYDRAFRGFEYRLGLLQEARTFGGGWRANPGEYLLDRAQTSDGQDVPASEIQFQKAVARTGSQVWVDLLGGADHFDQALIDHREVLKQYRHW